WDYAGPKREKRPYRYMERNFWRDLRQWDPRLLCQFSSEHPERPVRFVAMETGYDVNRVGPRLRDERNFDPNKVVFQLEALDMVRKEHPYVWPADLFAGAVLASRWRSTNPEPETTGVIDRKTYVWDISLAPDDGGCIADDGWIPTGKIYAGYGDVSFITGMNGGYSRRMVMSPEDRTRHARSGFLALLTREC
ncbi:MAG: hypothetical protein AAB971_03060, partial [Patescibacteria group bacterium]